MEYNFENLDQASARALVRWSMATAALKAAITGAVVSLLILVVWKRSDSEQTLRCVEAGATVEDCERTS